MPNRVDQADVANALRGHEGRIGILERFVGRWSYVLPIVPGNIPPDYNPDDPFNVPFQNSWANVSGGQPLRFRNFPATKVEIIGAVTGGTAPSIVFTLPNSSFFPPNDTPILFPSTDGSATWQGLIDTSGNVWILSTCECGEGELTVSDGETSVEDVDSITFDGATVADDGGGAVTVTITGGGGLPTGWTEDGSDPANVDSNGGNLLLDGGTFDTDDGTQNSSVQPTSVQVNKDAGAESYAMEIGGGIVSVAPTGVPGFSATDGAGATVAIDGGAMLASDFADPVSAQDLVTLAYLEAHPAGWPDYSGSGSPAGVVDAAAIGKTYLDTDVGHIWIAWETGMGGWLSVGGFVDEAGAFGVLLDDVSSGEWQAFDPVAGVAGLSVQAAAAAVTTYPPAYTANNTLDDGTSDAKAFFGQVDALALGPTIPYVTLQAGTPSTYQTPLVFDTTAITGGLYGWDGSAYQKIGGPL